MAVKAAKAGSIKKLKTGLKRGGSDAFIKSVPKDATLTVRFLTEPDEWFQYTEYYSAETEPHFFPATEGMDPSFVEDLDKPSKRYLACCVDRDDQKVIALRMPKSLVESLMRKYDKFETIMDRDYELMREGEKFDTTYEAMAEVPRKFNASKYEVLDLMAVLEAQVPTELGGGAADDTDDDDEDDQPIRRRRSSTAVKKRRSAGSTGSRRGGGSATVDDDDDDDTPVTRRRTRPATGGSKTTARKRMKRAR